MKKVISLLIVISLLLSYSIVAFAENETVKNGDVIEFGNYPQTLVTDNNLIKKLDKAPKKWVSYEYCYHEAVKNEDGAYDLGYIGAPSDNMQYADFSYEGINYRGVNFHRIGGGMISALHWPNEEIYPDLNDRLNEVYYFIYEPISWVVIDADKGMVATQKIIDQQTYADKYYENPDTEICYTDNTMSKFANDYSESDLRVWLNNDFLNNAFTENQKNLIIANAYELDEYVIWPKGYNSRNSSVSDKISIPSSRELSCFNYASIGITDYASFQGYNGKLILTRTRIKNYTKNVQALPAETLDIDYWNGEQVNHVEGVLPIMKLSELKNNTSMKSFEEGNKCICSCHSLQHKDNFIAEFIRKFIVATWELFSCNKYCTCDLRHY